MGVFVTQLRFDEDLLTCLPRVAARAAVAANKLARFVFNVVTEEQIIEFCRDRLAGFKRPRSVVFVGELPRNVMGKVLKRDLREEFSHPVENRE